MAKGLSGVQLSDWSDEEFQKQHNLVSLGADQRDCGL